MRLRDAILKAAALSQGGPLALVGSKPGRVVTHQGPLLVSMSVDGEDSVPWGLVDSKALSRALRDLHSDPVLESDGTAIIARANGSFARVPCIDVPIPSVPALPDLKQVPDWPVIAQVFHAAGRVSEDRPELDCVRFGEDVTEATDTVRVARASIGIGSGQLVPAVTFDRWPENECVAAAFSGAHGWFQVGDELRVARLLQGWFPSLQNHARVEHEGPRIRIPRRALEQAVTRAWKSSPMKAVHLRIVGRADPEAAAGAHMTPHIMVSRICSDASAVAFEARIEAEGGSDSISEFVFDGPRLTEALKALREDTAMIGYHTDQSQPLRFEADRYVELLFPLVMTK